MNEQAMTMNQQQKQHQQLMNMNPNPMSLNQMNPQQLQQSQPQMLPINRSYGVWLPHMQPQPPFQKPNPNVVGVNPPPSTFKNPFGPRSSWKGKRIIKANDKRRKEQHKSLMAGNSGGGLSVDCLFYNVASSPTDSEIANQFDDQHSKLGVL